MAKILFKQNIDLCGFNIGTKDISYPPNINIDNDIEESTQNSLVFSFVGNDMYQNDILYAKYKSQALSRDKFILYRQSLTDKVKKYIATIDNVTNGFYDYNVSNNEKYKYTVETNPMDKTDDNASEMSVTLETISFIKPHWNYWSICDIEKNLEASQESGADIYVPSDQVFIIKNNITAGSISNNLNIIKYNTLGQYGNVMQTPQKFDSGNVSCLINDFMAIQDVRNTQHIVVKDDILTPTERDNFLMSVEPKFQSDDCCFIFPQIDNTYYSYQPNNAVKIYKKLNINLNLIDNINFWNDSYYEYYEYDEKSQQYNKLQAYIPISISPPVSDEQKKQWNDTYLQYYIRDVHGVYHQNIDSTYNGNIQYYIYQIPEFKNDYYYYLAVNPWRPIPSRYSITNDIQKIRAWRECLSNGKLKLLKAPNGQKWVVKINGQNTLDVMWNSVQYPTTISFDWQEILDINKISIIKW